LRVKRLDVKYDETLKELHTAAIGAGKWRGTSAIHDHVTYWACGVQAYFDAAGHDHASHSITMRELLRDYDPGLYSTHSYMRLWHAKVTLTGGGK
jgi:hypothetical protein